MAEIEKVQELAQAQVEYPKRRRMTRKQSERAKREIVHLLAAGLAPSTAYKLACVPPRTYRYWYANDPQFRQNVDRALALAMGRAESTILSAIQQGDTSTAKWYLERRSPEYRLDRTAQETEEDDYEIVLMRVDSDAE